MYAYFHVLCALPAPIIEKLVTESRVTRLFALLGAKDDALDVEKQIVLVNAERIGTTSFYVYSEIFIS